MVSSYLSVSLKLTWPRDDLQQTTVRCLAIAAIPSVLAMREHSLPRTRSTSPRFFCFYLSFNQATLGRIRIIGLGRFSAQCLSLFVAFGLKPRFYFILFSFLFFFAGVIRTKKHSIRHLEHIRRSVSYCPFFVSEKGLIHHSVRV